MAQFQKQYLGSNAQTPDVVRVVNAMSANLEDLFAGQPRSEVLLQKVSLAAGPNQVKHTLGRTLTGWYLTRIRAAATVSDDQDNQRLPSTYLTLVASAPVVVDLKVF